MATNDWAMATSWLNRAGLEVSEPTNPLMESSMVDANTDPDPDPDTDPDPDPCPWDCSMEGNKQDPVPVPLYAYILPIRDRTSSFHDLFTVVPPPVPVPV